MKVKDIISAQNSIKKLAKQAVEGLKSQAAQIDREIEHEVVFEWVVQSADELIRTMPTNLQKNFARRVQERVDHLQMEREGLSQNSILAKTSEKLRKLQDNMN